MNSQSSEIETNSSEEFSVCRVLSYACIDCVDGKEGMAVFYYYNSTEFQSHKNKHSIYIPNLMVSIHQSIEYPVNDDKHINMNKHCYKKDQLPDFF